MLHGQPATFVVSILNRYTRPGDTLLDVGCGPGFYRNCTPATYVGLDNNVESYYTDGARQIDIIGSGAQLPIRDTAVDMVMIKSAFYQFPEPMVALVDFYRVLKPGGRILLFDYNRRTQKRLERTEGVKRPCWTQRELKRLLEEAGFRQCNLLLPTTFSVPFPLKTLLLVAQEIGGSWAVVTGVK